MFEKKLMEMILKDPAKRVKREYKVNELIIRAGDVGNECYVVESGGVEVFEMDGESSQDAEATINECGDKVSHSILIQIRPYQALCVLILLLLSISLLFASPHVTSPV